MSTRDPQTIEGEARAVAAYQEPPRSSNPFDADPAQFAVSVRQRGENYEALITWLCSHMVQGEDMVQIHVVKKDNCNQRGPHPYGNCSPSINPGHWSDPDLSKKGAEKICGLLGLGVRFLGMEDFRRMALKGTKIQDVITDCELYGASGTALSQGTGACSVDEVNGSLNRAMKTAVKRAHIDAVKRIAGLSGIATELKRRMPPVNLARAQEGLPQRGSAKPAAEGDRAYSTGARLTHCPIGKHKGEAWRDIPSEYLEWLVRECGNKPDIVKAAAGELTKRRGPTAPSGSDSIRTPSPPPSPASKVDERNPPPMTYDDFEPDEEIPF